jgi:hypothetical protein
MNIVRRSKTIILMLIAGWLLMSLLTPFGGECLCCNYTNSEKECCAKTHAKECCLDGKNISQNCQCHCISCGQSATNELLPSKEYINTFGLDQLSTIEHVPSDNHISINEQNSACYHFNTFPLKYPSLFLINSSFLL